MIPVRRAASVLVFSIMLLLPAYASAQNSDRITILDNFGDFEKGGHVFVYGNVAQIIPDSFLIIQIINPNGDLCQIQQFVPLSNGHFITEPIPLSGAICGLVGNYQVKIFYGDDSKTASFRILSSSADQKSGAQYLDEATKLVSEKIQSIAEKTGTSTIIYSERLNQINLQPSDSTIPSLETLYVDLWDDFFIEDEIFEINVLFRPAISDALDSTAQLVESGKLSFDIAREIDRDTYGAIFYAQLGDTQKTINKLNDSFAQIRNVDPIKVPEKRSLTFAELEDTLLNIMTKSKSIMSTEVKEEIAFIFSRGTAPLFADEIDQMVDLLTKSRYLDVILRNNDPLYKIIKIEWDAKRNSLIQKSSMEELLAEKESVDQLHHAALILRQLDNVDRFISSDEEQNSRLANLLLNDWNELESQLELATSVDNILELEPEINNLKKVIESSSRISKAMEVLQESNIDSELLDEWESLLIQVENAASMTEVLDLVSVFDQTIVDMREKRNPLSVLKFEYDSLKTKAELQNDQKNLFTINNALKIINIAQDMQDGKPSITKIDRIEVLLTWASAKAPEIRSELNSYSKDAYKVRASDILQRAKSIENLVDLSLRTNKFLPGFIEFTDSMRVKIDDVRELVMKNDLDAADNLVREAFSDWQEVTLAYESDPFGSEVGYSVDELKRIEYRKKLSAYSNAVTNFYNTDFEQYSGDYLKLVDEASSHIDYGNFIDAESKVNEIGSYLTEHLVLNNPKIIYDITYDQETGYWILSGAVDKPLFDRRENLYVTIYDSNGNTHSNLKFTDTRHGEFFTQWEAPTQPGLYVIMLQYQNVKASQIVNIEDKEKRTFSTDDLDGAELAREFEELKKFIETFGGDLNSNQARFNPIFEEIKNSLADRDLEKADDKLSELKRLIERYLPIRSRTAVIEAELKDDQLFISGAVQKTLSFREDLFVDIFDQQGNHVEEIALKDSSSGKFNEKISKPFKPGIYVAQLQYHDIIVSDFFNVLK